MSSMIADFIEYQNKLEYMRYAASIASHPQANAEEKETARKIARNYDAVLAKAGAALLADFDHHRVTMQ